MFDELNEHDHEFEREIDNMTCYVEYKDGIMIILNKHYDMDSHSLTLKVTSIEDVGSLFGEKN